MTSALKEEDEGGVMKIEPSHISVRSWGQWFLGGDNNYIDHLQEGSVVCIRELVSMVLVEDVVEVVPFSQIVPAFCA